MVFRLLGWAGLQHFCHTSISCHLGLLSRLHGLRFWELLFTGYSHQDDFTVKIVVYPSAPTLLLAITTYQYYWLLPSSTKHFASKLSLQRSCEDLHRPCMVLHMDLRHGPEQPHFTSVSDMQRWTIIAQILLFLSHVTANLTAHPLLRIDCDSHPRHSDWNIRAGQSGACVSLCASLLCAEALLFRASQPYARWFVRCMHGSLCRPPARLITSCLLLLRCFFGREGLGPGPMIESRYATWPLRNCV